MCISNCKNYCMYNYVGLEPVYCKIHKMADMVDMRPYCHSCSKRATFNGYCATHKQNKKQGCRRVRFTLSDTDKRKFLRPNEITMDDFELNMNLFDRPCRIIPVFDIKLVTVEELNKRISVM